MQDEVSDMFCEERVAQMAAYLLSKDGGRMPYLKLMKLLYLSDRESMNRFGESLSGDHMVAMPHGPVLSRSLDMINGREQGQEIWKSWVDKPDRYDLALKRQHFDRNDLDELSDSDLSILENVYCTFGHMDKWEIRDYTHEKCAEWKDPKGGSYPITPESVFSALGKSDEQVRLLSDRMREFSELARITSGLK
ncbi:TPA: SocA family protein [Klebsiella pneumoniae subsp. pneumoniae]|uniref:Panacea domain-containing protein n=1 Tax=Klebsiella pneumoniae complex TaxID=3390273 RepID=UPI0010BED652|nr:MULTISPECIES: Panacea domain-containing protein [Klebsiella]TKI32857.1 DUF4065 domain-containing protein [Klebsiella variicola]HBT2411615.1 SocA family protein [Klebsiella pneumoniae subsp. pneumoniae]